MRQAADTLHAHALGVALHEAIPPSRPAVMVSGERWAAERDEKDRITLKLIECEGTLRHTARSRARWRFAALACGGFVLGIAVVTVVAIAEGWVVWK